MNFVHTTTLYFSDFNTFSLICQWQKLISVLSNKENVLTHVTEKAGTVLSSGTDGYKGSSDIIRPQPLPFSASSSLSWRQSQALPGSKMAPQCSSHISSFLEAPTEVLKFTPVGWDQITSPL